MGDGAQRPASTLAGARETFGIGEAEALALARAATALVSEALVLAVPDDEVAVLLPDDFHADLRALLSRLLQRRLGEWREEHDTASVSALPRLEGVSWHAYRRPAPSSARPTATAPSVLLSLRLEADAGCAPAAAEAAAPAKPQREVHVEMSKQQLDSMLEGLGKIKEQLAQV